MIHGRDIVCFANDWTSDPTSKTHVMRRLARDNRVLWVDSIGCRAPRPSARDLRRMARKLRDFGRGCRRVERGLWVLSPLALPFHGNRVARLANRRFLAFSLRRAMRRLGFRDVLTWTFVPTSAGIAGALGERLVVYHCVDEFSRFTGVDREALCGLEAELAGRADVVLVSAERLLRDKAPLNPRTFLVRHGVEVEHFARALDPATAVPADLDACARPRVGFFGLIADWVDLDLVAHVARERPGWSLVLIGGGDADLSPLAGLPNVKLLGRRDYRDLPGYCRGLDAAIVPFRLNELTLASNPLKLREYLAAGLPVVSTAVPEAERLAPWVRIGRDRDGFLRELDDLLAGGDVGPSPRRAEAVGAESWDRRTEEMCAIVAPFLAAADAGSAGPAAPLGLSPPAGAPA